MGCNQCGDGAGAETAQIANRCFERHFDDELARPIRLAFPVAFAWLVLIASVSNALGVPLAGRLPNQRARNEAIRAIPFDQMNEQVQAKLSRVVANPGIYRRLPVQVVDCDPDLYVFLVRYPEVLVNIWQLMDITKLQVRRTGPFTFDASDGMGTDARVELVYGRPELNVYYAEGLYEGPLFRTRITGRCVILLRSEFSKQNDRVNIKSCMDVFVDMDNVGAEIVVKTLHPLVGKTADFNFAETVKFIGQVSQASEMNGAGVERLAAKLANVNPDVRQTFAQYVEVVYQRSILRTSAEVAPAASVNPASAASRTVVPGFAPSSAHTSPMLEPVPPRRWTPIFSALMTVMNWTAPL